MDDQEIKEALLRMEERQEKILAEYAANNKRRDLWDKISAISPIISGMAIAFSALLCTYQYNQQQIKLQEAQTVERFIPHLMGNDTSKRMAILAMKTLVNTDLAAKYAAMFPSAGTMSALKQIAKTGDNQDKEIVYKYLHRAAENEDDKEKVADQNDPTFEAPSETTAKPMHGDQSQQLGATTPASETADQAKTDATVPGDKGRTQSKPQYTEETGTFDAPTKNEAEQGKSPTPDHKMSHPDRSSRIQADDNSYDL
jgi:hypothetical protein